MTFIWPLDGLQIPVYFPFRCINGLLRHLYFSGDISRSYRLVTYRNLTFISMEIFPGFIPALYIVAWHLSSHHTEPAAFCSILFEPGWHLRHVSLALELGYTSIGDASVVGCRTRLPRSHWARYHNNQVTPVTGKCRREGPASDQRLFPSDPKGIARQWKPRTDKEWVQGSVSPWTSRRP